MAKAGKKNSGKNSAQSKLPKRIAGMKVPKALRRSSGRAAQWAASPIGREILGATLVAAASAIAGSKKARGAIKEGAKDAASGASRVGQALADAAVEVVRRAVPGDEQSAPANPDRKAAGNKRGKSRPGSPTFTH